MILCKWTIDEQGGFQYCCRCDPDKKDPKPITDRQRVRRCKAEAATQDFEDTAAPGLSKKLIKYTGAIARWKAAGSPKRTNQEVEYILVTYCQPCVPYFTGTHCVLCGCRINKSRIALINKIRMATEHCPKEKW